MRERYLCLLNLFMKRFIVFGIVFCLVVLAGQSQSLMGERLPPNTSAPDSVFYSGMMAIKVDQSSPIRFEKNTEGHWETGNRLLDAILKKWDARDVVPMYQTLVQQVSASENQQALQNMQKAGLMQWYCLALSPKINVRKACQSLQGLAGIAIAEPFAKIESIGVPSDTQFAQQWQWQNTGQLGGLPGADVNAVAAWGISTGLPEVVVSVHDGGVLATHPDLQQNMWWGTGFNFVTNTPTLTPDVHGTHVAGLVAAVRNNNLGVSGMAGGNGSPNSGVRLMSLQIIGGTPVLPGHEALAFVFAANNGAAISQNSWSYAAPNVFPNYLAEAIDYFIAHGGGQQMKGGLVVAASGNRATEDLYYPAAYSRVIAVAASTHTDERASYSNMGAWVDITAPGGDGFTPILSTVLQNDFGTLFGTSMASPIVSGTAGLLLSKLQGRVLPDDIRSLLLYGVDDIYPRNPPSLAGKLGAGRLNAFKALWRADSISRQPVIPPVSHAQLRIECDKVAIHVEGLQAGQKLIVAYAPMGTSIGHPFGRLWAVGDVMPEGATIVWVGSVGSIMLPLPIDGEQGEYRLWVNEGSPYNYSIGTNLHLEVPSTVTEKTFAAGADFIELRWQRQCPNRGLLLATSQNGRFGRPNGDPASLSELNGGGTVLQHGQQTGFTHRLLQPDQSYFYAFFPYQFLNGKWQYGAPQLLKGNTLCAAVNLPIVESFEGPVFPPPHFRVVDGGPSGSLVPDFKTWQQNNLAGSTPNNTYSALVNAYTQNGNGSKELLRTPAFALPFDTDSVVLRFDYAYRAYAADADVADSLQLVWSTDCGATYQPLWGAGGVQLATVPGLSTQEFIPTAQQWKRIQWRLDTLAPAGTVISIGFLATNNFGQNLWLDAIELQQFKTQQPDAAVVQWLSPAAKWVCSTPYYDSVAIANKGSVAINRLQLLFTNNGLSIDSVQLSGLQWAPGSTHRVRLPPLALTIGSNQLRVISRQPNDQPDSNPANDSLSNTIWRSGQSPWPLVESFETATDIPIGWVNPQLDQAWQVSPLAAVSGKKSATIWRMADTAATGPSLLVSPILQVEGQPDSLWLQFSVAAAMRIQGNQLLSDTLEIWITSSCGASRQTLMKLWGKELARAESNASFVPNAAQWITHRLSLTPWLNQLANGFQIGFSLYKSGGNNIWLDDISIQPQKIPPYLREQGFGVFPNPFVHQFLIWHLQPVPDWQWARVLDAQGRVLKQWQWNGNAPQTLQVNTANWPAGLYWLQLNYGRYQRTTRILKQ